MSYKVQTEHNIYWDSKLLVLGFCFAKLVKTGLWAVWAEQHAQLEIDHVTQQPEETCQRTQLLFSFGTFDSFLAGMDKNQVYSDPSQSDKNIKSVFFFNFTKIQFLNDKIYSYTKKNYLALGNLSKCKIEK